MEPILISPAQALEYGYSIKTICYLSHLILGEIGPKMRWREAVATPDEDDEGWFTGLWTVELYVDGDVQHIGRAISLRDARQLLIDWTSERSTRNDTTEAYAEIVYEE